MFPRPRSIIKFPHSARNRNPEEYKGTVFYRTFVLLAPFYNSGTRCRRCWVSNTSYKNCGVCTIDTVKTTTAVMLCASLAVASLQSNRNWRTSAVEVLTTNDNQRQMDMGQNCSKYTTLTMRILTMLSAENSNGNGLEYRTVTHIQTM